MRSEFGKPSSSLRPNVRPDPDEPLRIQEAEAEVKSNVSPKNQFAPRIKLLPRPRLTGISVSAMFDLTHPLKWVFSAKYRRQCREEKNLARKQGQHEERLRRSRRS